MVLDQFVTSFVSLLDIKEKEKSMSSLSIYKSFSLSNSVSEQVQTLQGVFYFLILKQPFTLDFFKQFFCIGLWLYKTHFDKFQSEPDLS